MQHKLIDLAEPFKYENMKGVPALRMKGVPALRHYSALFSDVRRSIAKAALEDNFSRLYPLQRKSAYNSFVAALLRMAA